MPEDRKTLAELAITDLERTADEYRAMAVTASTAADRDSHTRVADGFVRIIERRKQAVPRQQDWVGAMRGEVPHAGKATMIGNWSIGNPLLSTTLWNQTGSRYHMTVERLARNKWEWLAWREADAVGQVVQRGVTSSSDTAMVAAEDAAVTLEIVAAAGRA